MSSNFIMELNSEIPYHLIIIMEKVLKLFDSFFFMNSQHFFGRIPLTNAHDFSPKNSQNCTHYHFFEARYSHLLMFIYTHAVYICIVNSNVFVCVCVICLLIRTSKSHEWKKCYIISLMNANSKLNDFIRA